MLERRGGKPRLCRAPNRRTRPADASWSRSPGRTADKACWNWATPSAGPSVSSTSRVSRIDPPRLSGCFWSKRAQGLPGGVELVELKLDQGLARQEPGIVGDLGQPFVQRLERRLDTGRSPRAAAHVRRRLRPSGSTTCTSVRSRRGKANRGRPTPSWAFLGKVVSRSDGFIDTLAKARARPSMLMPS